MVKKKTKSRETRTQKAESQSFLQQLRLGESYTSLVLGIVVVVIMLVLVIVTARNFLPQQPTQDISSDKIEEVQRTAAKSTYTVKAGDTLWSIAESQYKSGYNWTDIAKANNLNNPGVIEEGTKLVIPVVTPIATVTPVATMARAPTVSPTVAPTTAPEAAKVPNAIIDKVYVVKPGECLWDIAVRAYGDGYRWVELARVNKVSGPEYIIFKDDRLTIPR